MTELSISKIMEKVYTLQHIVTTSKPTVKPEKPFSIFYEGIPLETIMLAMRLLKSNPECKDALGTDILDAVEGITNDASWSIALERTS